MDKLTFKIEEFEGPLDLLLFLIQKHKLDIRDIQITQLLEQYLAYLEAAQRADLEVASEFLEMASRLVYLKTVMLLPRRREEGQQLKQELQGQLLEYQVCKLMAAQLAGRDRGELVFVRQPQPLPEGGGYRLRHPPQRLYDAYRDAIGRGRQELVATFLAVLELVKAQRITLEGERVRLERGHRRAAPAREEEAP